jgi:hypothetical protein
MWFPLVGKRKKRKEKPQVSLLPRNVSPIHFSAEVKTATGFFMRLIQFI